MAKKVKVIDRGWNKAMRDMGELSRSRVKVGLAAGKAGADTAVIDYAMMQEFGTEHIPARPFMRHTADTKEKDTYNLARRSVASMLVGRLSVDGVLTQMGEFYRNWIKNSIKFAPSWAKPNAPSTIAIKGSSSPLIDQGVMSGAIQFEKERE